MTKTSAVMRLFVTIGVATTLRVFLLDCLQENGVRCSCRFPNEKGR